MSCADQLMQMKRNFNAARVEFKAVAAERDAALAENAKLREALTPSAETKAAYIGEFSFQFPTWSESGEEVVMTPTVPWVTIKGIMAAIRARALVSPP